MKDYRHNIYCFCCVTYRLLASFSLLDDKTTIERSHEEKVLLQKEVKGFCTTSEFLTKKLTPLQSVSRDVDLVSSLLPLVISWMSKDVKRGGGGGVKGY